VKYDKPSILAILEHYGARVPTRKGWFSMRCPFHDDRHNSASANTDENVFCCFACQVKGDGYTLIMNKEGVGFREAIHIAQGILNSRGEVLPQRNRTGGGLPRRTGDIGRRSNESGLGRRSRAYDGS
jgi:DNA primase